MNCPDDAKWLELSIGQVAANEAEKMVVHADQCQACADKLAEAENEHRLIHDWHETANADQNKNELFESITEALACRERDPNVTRSGHRLLTWGVNVMRQPTAKISLAILVPAACIALIILPMFNATGGVAFADVQRAMDRMNSVICRFRTGVGDFGEGRSKSYSKLYLSPQYGKRQDTYVNDQLTASTYVPIDGPVVSVNRTDTYIIRKSQPAAAASQSNPTAWLEGLKRIAAEEVATVVEDTLDGKPALLFEVTPLGGRLWVSPETMLPLKYVAGPRAVSQKHGNMVYDQFEWDQNIPASDFQPENVENAFEVVSPSFDVDGFVESLQFFAEHANGSYPNSLECEAVNMELAKLTEYFGAFSEDGPYKARVTQANLYLGNACLFFKKLVQNGAEPEYFGEFVNNDQPTSVLMTWQNADGTQTEIYGNLKVIIRD